MSRNITLLCLIVLFSFLPQLAAAVDGEITYTGTNTTLTGDDVAAGPFNLGFTFNFYGTDYTTAYVNINGTVNFGASYNRYANVPLSTALSGTNIADNTIYAFWDDLNTNGAQNIYYATVGAEPNRMFVTQWTNIYFHGTSIQMGTFQAILYEGTNVVQIQYRDLLGGDRALGNSATVGIRKNNSTYSQYLYNTASLTQEQAIRYTPDGLGGYTVDTNADYELVYLAPAGAPTSPTLVNPTDGSTGVTLAPTFEWLPVDSATSYTVLISTVSNFSSTVVNQSGVTGTSYTPGSNLSASTNYYWRVQAVNSNGSSLSPTRSFTTGSTNTAPNTPASVASDTLIGGIESDDIIGDTLTATLSDDDDAEQVRYRIQIATDNSFNNLVVDYRSPFGDEGAVTYTVGEDGGTYLVGNATTTFAADDYYLRIRTEDDAAASSAWNTASGIAFTITADETAPNISSLSVSPESNSAEIVWSTDEAASSRVEYGPSTSYTASTTESNTSTRVTSHSVTISGLRECIKYYYHVTSRDAAGNTATSTASSFTTKGCTGLALVLDQTDTVVATTTGASVALLSSGAGVTITIPTNYATSSAYFQIKKLDPSMVVASTSRPTGYSSIGGYTYALHAVTEDLATISEFDEDITMTMSYTDDDIVGIDEATLKIYRWDGVEWVELSGCVVDTGAQTVTCATDHFSTFSLFGQASSESEESSESSSGGASGSSVQARVKNLLDQGNAAGAQALMSQWPHLFELPPVSNEKLAEIETLPLQNATTTITDIKVRDLKIGYQGIDVKQLQSILINLGSGSASKALAGVGATGYFGTYTRDALAEYQKLNSISPSQGYFGAITRAQMKRADLRDLWW